MFRYLAFHISVKKESRYRLWKTAQVDCQIWRIHFAGPPFTCSSQHESDKGHFGVVTKHWDWFCLIELASIMVFEYLMV